MPSLSLDQSDGVRSGAWALIRGLATIGWALVRLPALALLIILEPFVCGLLWLLSTLGVLTSLFYRFLVRDPRFPFWGCLALSIGLALLAAVYDAAIRVLGGRQD